MPSNIRRLERLEGELLTPKHPTIGEEGARLYRFGKNLEAGTASQSDLDGCPRMMASLHRQLVTFANELQELHDAGELYPIRFLDDWAARVLLVPADEPVPGFITDALEPRFESAWSTAPIDLSRGVFSREQRVFNAHMQACLVTAALGTPDAAQLRQKIAEGDFDGPRGVVRYGEHFIHHTIKPHPDAVPDKSGLPRGSAAPYWTFDGEYVDDVKPITPPPAPTTLDDDIKHILSHDFEPESPPSINGFTPL